MFNKFFTISTIGALCSLGFIISPAHAEQVGGTSGAIFCPSAPGNQIAYGGNTGKTAQQAAAECREYGGTPRMVFTNKMGASPKVLGNITAITPSNAVPDIEVKCNDGMSAWWNPGWPTGNTQADAIAICVKWHGGVKTSIVRPNPKATAATMSSQNKNDIKNIVKDTTTPITGHD